MSVLLGLADKAVVILRPAATTGRREAYATVTAAVMEIQPVELSKQPSGDGTYGKLYNGYADSSYDIRERDRFREVATGHVYQVRNGGVSRRVSPGGAVDFLHLSMELVS